MPDENQQPANSVTPAKLFGVGVRLLAIWELLNGLDDLIAYGNAIAHVATASSSNAPGFLAHAIEHLIAGSILLFGARMLVARFYGDQR